MGSTALIGHPVTITSQSVLRKFGLVSRGSGVNVKMGLYLDGGALVASTEGTVLVGRNEFSPTASTTLNPGKYWIMAIYSASVTIAHQNPAANERRLLTRDFTLALPGTLTGASSNTGNQANYYIQVTP
jgi:hypothetical protein